MEAEGQSGMNLNLLDREAEKEFDKAPQAGHTDVGLHTGGNTLSNTYTYSQVDVCGMRLAYLQFEQILEFVAAAA